LQFTSVYFGSVNSEKSISTRADNTIKIVIGTQELSPEEATALFGLKGKLGWLLFSENVLTELSIPKEPAPEFKSDKSPSQRLRAVLYKFWELNTNKVKSFDTFYKEWVEKKIREVKELLLKD